MLVSTFWGYEHGNELWNRCYTKCLDSPNAHDTQEEAFGEVLGKEPKGDGPSLKSQAG